MGNRQKNIIDFISAWQGLSMQAQGRAELILEDDGNLEAADLLRALGNLDLDKYCCEFMKEQLTHTCNQHGLGKDCPDVIIHAGSSGQRYIEGRNATYACIYCPHCGTRHEPSVLYFRED